MLRNIILQFIQIYLLRAIVEKLFTSRGKKMYNESEVKKDVKQ